MLDLPKNWISSLIWKRKQTTLSPLRLLYLPPSPSSVDLRSPPTPPPSVPRSYYRTRSIFDFLTLSPVSLPLDLAGDESAYADLLSSWEFASPKPTDKVILPSSLWFFLLFGVFPFIQFNCDRVLSGNSFQGFIFGSLPVRNVIQCRWPLLVFCASVYWSGLT